MHDSNYLQSKWDGKRCSVHLDSKITNGVDRVVQDTKDQESTQRFSLKHNRHKVAENKGGTGTQTLKRKLIQTEKGTQGATPPSKHRQVCTFKAMRFLQLFVQC